MSITVAALLNSLIESSSASVQHRSGATLDSVLRSFAESATYQIQLQGTSASGASGPAYTACAVPSNYQLLGPPTPATGPAGTPVTMFATGLSPGAQIQQVVLTPDTDPPGTSIDVPLSPYPSVDPNGDVTITFVVPTTGLTANQSYSPSISDSAGDSASSNDDFVFTPGSSSPASSSLAQYHLQVSQLAWWVTSAKAFQSPPGLSHANCLAHNDDTGIQQLTLTATAQDGTTGTLSFVVTDPGSEQPRQTSTDSPSYTFVVGGSSGPFNVTATGFPAPYIKETGSLPTGVVFTQGNPGVLAGQPAPASGTGGTYPITFMATNSAGTTSWPATVTVEEAAQITSANTFTFTTNAAGVPKFGSFTVSSLGYPAPTFSCSQTAEPEGGPSSVPCMTGGMPTAGVLPPGVSFDNTTGVLSGTPKNSNGTGGVYNVTFTATNTIQGVVQTDSQDVTIYVDQRLFTSTNHATFSRSMPNPTFTVTATGYPTPFTYTATGLPVGVTLTSGGILSGNPPATDPIGKKYHPVFTATNSAGQTTQNFTLTVGT